MRSSTSRNAARSSSARATWSTRARSSARPAAKATWSSIPLKGKKLTNIRTQSKDENVLLTPPIRMSLEQAMEYIGDDELVEVTPKNIRLRKRHLSEGDRKRAERVA